MKLKIYNIRDNVEGSFGPLLSSINDDLLRRDLKGWMSDKHPNIVNQNFRDKSVYLTAVYDTETGVIVGLPNPEFICPLVEIYDALIADMRKWKEDKESVGIEDEQEVSEN